MTKTATADPVAAVDALLDAIYGDARVVAAPDLAGGIGISVRSLHRACERGDLHMIRVSERRLVIARGEARRYLVGLQERER